MTSRISIILPVYNENHEGLWRLVSQIRDLDSLSKRVLEIVVVDDGSEPPVPKHDGVRIVRHPRNLGNGAAIKTGARNAKGGILVFMDADGQHKPSDIPLLLEKLDEGYDLVVGARLASSHSSLGRRLANGIYNTLASFMTGHDIKDLTSGFRAARSDGFRRFLYLLPNGFSYPTTSTMAFFRSGFPVAYVPIKAEQRAGVSKIRWIKDGVRFFVIILKIGALFSPMRLFLPVSGLLFLAGGLYYSYTYFTIGRFTNMSALLFLSSLFSFLIGVLSEQISSLHYKEDDRRHNDGHGA